MSWTEHDWTTPDGWAPNYPVLVPAVRNHDTGSIPSYLIEEKLYKRDRYSTTNWSGCVYLDKPFLSDNWYLLTVALGQSTGAHPGTPHPAFTTYNCAIVPRKILHDVIRTTQPTPLSLWAAPRTLHILHGALDSAVEAPRGEAIRAQLCTASIASYAS